jgi:three-Cys-motif partner protein
MTAVSIQAVADYLSRFNTALSKQSFRRIYIDAFAGSGDFAFDAEEMGTLFDSIAAKENHAGSAQRALQTTPPFHEHFFIEMDRRNVESLRDLVSRTSPSEKVDILVGDANSEVIRICEKADWSSTRGVIFLDPFGNQVNWSTLEAISRTKLDVWYLFPLSGVFRNAPHDQSKLTEDKRASISRIVGTDEWERRFYDAAPSTIDMFDAAGISARRSMNVDGIEAFMTDRLRSIFPMVEGPRRLLTANKAPLFSLYFAMANKSVAAHKIARPIVKHILRSI